MRVTLGGCRVDLLTEDELLGDVRTRLGGTTDRRSLFVASANLDHVHRFGAGASSQPGFEPTERVDWLVTLDGWPVALAARRHTSRWWPVLAGSDVLPGLLAVAADEHARVGFLGGTEGLWRAFEHELAFPGRLLPEKLRYRLCRVLGWVLRPLVGHMVIVSGRRPGEGAS